MTLQEKYFKSLEERGKKTTYSEEEYKQALIGAYDCAIALCRFDIEEALQLYINTLKEDYLNEDAYKFLEDCLIIAPSQKWSNYQIEKIGD